MWWLGYGLKDKKPWLDSWRCRNVSPLENLLDRLYDPTIYLANGYREKTHFPRAKWPGFQNHQSLPSSGEVENERIYISTAPIRRFEVNGDKFIFLHLPIMSFWLVEFVVGIIVESIEKYPVTLTILIQVEGQSTHNAIVNSCEEILRNSDLNHPYSCNASTHDEVRHTLTADNKQVKTLLKSLKQIFK
jgi:hypothetical protein